MDWQTSTNNRKRTKNKGSDSEPSRRRPKSSLQDDSQRKKKPTSKQSCKPETDSEFDDEDDDDNEPSLPDDLEVSDDSHEDELVIRESVDEEDGHDSADSSNEGKVTPEALSPFDQVVDGTQTATVADFGIVSAASNIHIHKDIHAFFRIPGHEVRSWGPALLHELFLTVANNGNPNKLVARLKKVCHIVCPQMTIDEMHHVVIKELYTRLQEENPHIQVSDFSDYQGYLECFETYAHIIEDSLLSFTGKSVEVMAACGLKSCGTS